MENIHPDQRNREEYTTRRNVVKQAVNKAKMDGIWEEERGIG